jgi:hypothetical protein
MSVATILTEQNVQAVSPRADFGRAIERRVDGRSRIHLAAAHHAGELGR